MAFRRSMDDISRFQDEQLNILQSLESNFVKSITDTEKLKDALGSVYRSLDTLVKNPQAYKQGVDSANSLYSSMNKILERQARDAARRDGSITNIINKYGVSQEKASALYEQAANQQIAATKFIYEKAKELFSYLGNIADNWSTLSNNMIKISGMSEYAVRQYRSELTDIVATMNKTTGYAFDAQESYKNVIAMIGNVTGDLDAMREMARPMLLANETLPGNITSITELFNKFYVRYNFSSKNMENVLDNIRGNTAGNTANAESIANAMNSLKSVVAIQSKGDAATQEKLFTEISDFVAYQESLGISSTTTVKLVEDIFKGNYDASMLSTLARGGVYGAGEARALLESGDWREIADAYNNGLLDLMTELYDGGAVQIDKILQNRGLNTDYALDVYAALRYGNVLNSDEFLESVSDAQTMEQLTEGKYVSLTEKTHNFLSSMTEKLADIQENLGFGFTDVVKILGWIGNIIIAARILGAGGGGSLGSLLGRLGGAGISSGIMSSLTSSWSGVGAFNQSSGLLSSTLMNAAGAAGGLGGAAMLGGGLAVGGIAAYDGIKGAMNTDKDTFYRVASGIQGAAGIGGMGALLALGVSNPVGWIALAAAGGAFLVKSIYDSSNAYKNGAKIVKREFDNMKSIFSEEYEVRKSNLGEIKGLLSDDTTVEEGRQALIDSELLSDDQLNNINSLDAAGLQDLTDALLESAEYLKEATQAFLDKYSEKQQESTNEVLKSINLDNLVIGQNKQDSDNYYKLIIDAIKSSIEKKSASGIALTDEESKFMSGYNKYIANNSNPTPLDLYSAMSSDNLQKALGKSLNLLYSNVAGQDLEDLTVALRSAGATGVKRYKHRDSSDLANYIAPIAIARSAEEASNALAKAAAAGMTTEYYSSEINKAIRKWGLTEYGRGYDDYIDNYNKQLLPRLIALFPDPYPSYDIGTNYVSSNQLALIHEGEAVVPKAYNPAAGNAGILAATKRLLEDSGSDPTSRQERKDISLCSEEISKIREILSNWKSSTEKRDRINNLKNSKTSSASRYMLDT